MAKSSINFAKASAGGLRHNDRTEAPSYLLPKEFRLSNDCDISAKEAEKKIQDLYSAAKDNYQEKFGQKLQAKSYTWEAVINLNKEHTLEDVQRLTKEIEKETGFTSVQIAVHRDEGRIERNIPIYNIHAHVTFFTLDKETGEQLYRRQVTDKQKKRDIKPMNRERLSKIQDLTAKSLSMERGKKGSKTVRLDHKAYKATKQAELAKQKDLKDEIKKLREKLKEQDAIREDYAKLEQLNKELKERIRLKELTISELEEIKANYFAMKTEYTEETTAMTKSELEDVQEELDEALETIEIQSKEIAKLEEENTEISWQKTKTEEELAEEKDKNEVLAEEIEEVLEENEKWADAYNTLKNAYDKLKGTFSELKEKYKIVAEAYVELKEKFTKKEEATQEQSNIRRR